MVQFLHSLPADPVVSTNRKAYVVERCRGKKVLHVGCVDAGLTESRLASDKFLHTQIQAVASRVWGVDVDAEGLDVMRRHGIADLFHADGESLDSLELDDKPDLIVACEILEHLPNPGRFLDALKHYQCEVLISVPNAYSFRAFRALSTGQELVHEDHNYYFSITSLSTMLRKHGFEVLERGVYYWPSEDELGQEIRTLVEHHPFYGDGLLIKARPAQARRTETLSLRPVVKCFAAGNNFHFAEDLLVELNARGYDARRVPCPEMTEEEAVRFFFEEMRSCDLAYFEWADGWFPLATHLPKVCPIVCRLHRYEAYTGNLKEVKWEHVDAFIFISPVVERTFKELHPEAALKRSLIVPNAISLERYPLKPQLERGFKIAQVARIFPIKNLPMTLQIMAALVKRDPRYTCHIAGAVQDLTLFQYLGHLIEKLNLKEHVFLEGHVSDVDRWLEDKTFLLSTSYLEGHPVNVMESMARGLKPVLHDYFGDPSAQYGAEFVYRTIDEAVEKILAPAYEPERYRAIVSERYSLGEQVDTFERLFWSVEPNLKHRLFGVAVDAVESALERQDRQAVLALLDDLARRAPEDEMVRALLAQFVQPAGPSPLEGSQPNVFVYVPEWQASTPVEALGAYLDAFTPEDTVTLAVYLPKAVAEADAVAVLEAKLAERKGPQADVLVFTQPLRPGDWDGVVALVGEPDFDAPASLPRLPERAEPQTWRTCVPN